MLFYLIKVLLNRQLFILGLVYGFISFLVHDYIYNSYQLTIILYSFMVLFFLSVLCSSASIYFTLYAICITYAVFSVLTNSYYLFVRVTGMLQLLRRKSLEFIKCFGKNWNLLIWSMVEIFIDKPLEHFIVKFTLFIKKLVKLKLQTTGIVHQLSWSCRICVSSMIRNNGF